MQVKFHQMFIVIEELLPFDYLNFNDFFSVIIHNFGSNGWIFLKLLLSIYDHGLVMHMMFCRDILSTRGVIAL